MFHTYFLRENVTILPTTIKILEVIKRDKYIVPFCPEKIIQAVEKAQQATEQGVTANLAEQVLEGLNRKIKKSQISVEKIQDLVEIELMKSDRTDVAKAYILYREERTKARNAKSFDTMASIIRAESNDITKENANMSAETPSGMMMKFASETTKAYSLTELLKPEHHFLHRTGAIHIHDLDYYPTRSLTCVQHPLDKILENGMEVNHAALRRPNGIHGAAVMACISLETAQNEMHGGQAIPAFDFYMAPFVKVTYEKELKKACEFSGSDFDKLIAVPISMYKEKDLDGLAGNERVIQHALNRTINTVYQAMEGFIHNMNSIHSRGGNQVVFSSINYGTDTSPEGRCVMEQLLLSTERGVGNGQTAIFPIQIFKIKDGVNLKKGDANYDLFQLACRVTAKRFFPNFINLDAPFNQHEKWTIEDPSCYRYEAATMGCRTRVFENIHGEKTSIGRGNASFTSINLVRIALETLEEVEKEGLSENEKWARFYGKLEYLVEEVGEQLKIRYDFQTQALAKQFPTVMKYLWRGGSELKPEVPIKKVMNQSTLGIGFIGLAECLLALMGKHHGESDKAQTKGLEIVTFMRDKCTELKERHQLNYSLLATPAESLCKRFPKLDRVRFGKVAGINTREYYTNSNHIPVWYHISAVKKMTIEAPYHALTLGGHIAYIELDGKASENWQALEKMVLMAHHLDIGYFSLNHTICRCLDCGHETSDADATECEGCHSDHLDVIQRITGYLVGTTGKWNEGKKAELRDRVIHS
ncbi:anaerobic ribonucleoside triphosphate reductase [Neobacillus vireti]|uniref:anaerobic ribonucleoside triphosphate reductase n=1 Tax=Neobacillus vireti TaxID=220686 RepID=UPI002FFE2526